MHAGAQRRPPPQDRPRLRNRTSSTTARLSSTTARLSSMTARTSDRRSRSAQTSRGRGSVQPIMSDTRADPCGDAVRGPRGIDLCWTAIRDCGSVHCADADGPASPGPQATRSPSHPVLPLKRRPLPQSFRRPTDQCRRAIGRYGMPASNRTAPARGRHTRVANEVITTTEQGLS